MRADATANKRSSQNEVPAGALVRPQAGLRFQAAGLPKLEEQRFQAVGPQLAPPAVAAAAPGLRDIVLRQGDVPPLIWTAAQNGSSPKSFSCWS